MDEQSVCELSVKDGCVEQFKANNGCQLTTQGEITMATVFCATCPKCKQSIAFPPTELAEVRVNCSHCQHVFLARMPAHPRTQAAGAAKDATPRQIQADLHLDIPPLDLSSVAPSQQFWRGSRPSRQLHLRSLALAMWVALGLVVIGTIAVVLSRNWQSIAAIDLGTLGQTEDSCSAIFSDWSAIESKQQELTETIDHKSDCGPLTITFENLIERQQRLVTRAIRFGFVGRADGSKAESSQPLLLPDYPVTRSKRRPVEVYLTPEFRKLEASLNNASDAVLAYLHMRDSPLLEPGEAARKQVALHIQLLESLASLEQGNEFEKVTVLVYELSDQMEFAGAERQTSSPSELASPEEQAYLSLFRSMRSVMRERYAADSGSSLAKALTAFEHLVERP